MDDATQSTLKKFLINNEGYRDKLYTDSVGKITIGVGYCIGDRGLSYSIIDSLLDDDINYVVNSLNELFNWYGSLDNARQVVIADMAFNLGIKTFSTFRNLINDIENKDYKNAANEILNSSYAKQVVNRAINNAQIMKTGVLQWTV